VAIGKKQKSFKRGLPKRKINSKILIICEGKKTEPIYFRGLKDHFRLNGVNIEITGEGVNPRKIVKRAKDFHYREKKSGDSYDKVYCVFDKDRHTDYQEALNQIGTINDFEALTSVPAELYSKVVYGAIEKKRRIRLI